jgi:hypothetical protein
MEYMAIQPKKKLFRQENKFFLGLLGIFLVVGLYFAFRNFIPTFAVGTFSDDFFTIDGAEVAGGTTIGIWNVTGGGKAAATDSDAALEGTNALRLANASAATWGYHLSTSTSWNLANKQVWFDYFFASPKYRDYFSEFHVKLSDGIFSGTTHPAATAGNTAEWDFCTTLATCQNAFAAGWNIKKFFTTQPNSTSGTINLATTKGVYAWWTTSASTNKSGVTLLGMDFWRAGTKIIFFGGTQAAPVTFADIKTYSDDTNSNPNNPRPLAILDTVVNAITLKSSLQIGTSSQSTYFTDTNKYITMDMYNSDDKLSFTLLPNSTTTLGAYENGFAISGVTIAYPGGTKRSIPFRFPSSSLPLPTLNLYASKIINAEEVYFGESLTSTMRAGSNIFNTEIDSASTTFIYASTTNFSNVSIHHNVTSTDALAMYITPSSSYTGISIFAAKTNGLSFFGAGTTTMWNTTLSNNNAGYDIRVTTDTVNMVNSYFNIASTTYVNTSQAWILNKQYTIDVVVKDGSGNPINGANVVLNNNTTTVFATTTGSDGKIIQQIVTAYQITHAANTTTIVTTTYNNFILTVTSTNKNDSSQTLIINSPQDITVSLAGACDRDGTTPAYPMSFNSSTLQLTVWGNNTTSFSNCGIDNNQTCLAMGYSTSTAITFSQIKAFAKAAYGSCAVTSPAAGSFAVLSKLDIGNGVTTTYVKTFSESIDFGMQLKIKGGATLISGLITASGSPYSGSTLSVSGNDASSTYGQGQVYMEAVTSSLELYDSVFLNKYTTSSYDNAWALFWNGSVTAKRSSLENWWTVRFGSATNTLQDIVLTNVGEGLYISANQGASSTLETINARKTTEGGLYATGTAGFTITDLNISETGQQDVKVYNFNATSSLVNSTLDWDSIQWNGSGNGIINRQYTFRVKVVDSQGGALNNAHVVLNDNSTTTIDTYTNSSGYTAEYTITTDIYSYSAPTGTTKNNFTLSVTAQGKSDYTQTMPISSPLDFSVVMTSECGLGGDDPPYPMSFNSSTNQFVVWGDDGTGVNCGLNGNLPCTAMGTSSASAITFAQIKEFAYATNRNCSMSSPAAGSYALPYVQLNIGNGVTTTYVKTFSESINFGQQLVVKNKGYLISGLITASGSPYAGSTLSVSGIDATTTGQGQIYLAAGSNLALYDSVVLNKNVTSSYDNAWALFWNGSVTAKRSSLENWWTVRFGSATNTLQDIVLTNVGEGLYISANQGASSTLETINARKTTDRHLSGHFHSGRLWI